MKTIIDCETGEVIGGTKVELVLPNPSYEELKKRLSIAEKALEFYGQVEGWACGCGDCAGLTSDFIVEDAGKTARQALAEIRGDKK